MHKYLSTIFTTIVLLTTTPNRVNASQLLPYGIGYNLVVCADSILLMSDRPMHWSEGVTQTSDSTWVFTDGLLVVADVAIIPEDHQDSVWVKVAQNQWAMGWLHRSDLLKGTIPDNPVSSFMYSFRISHTRWMAFAYLIALLIIIVAIIRERHYKVVTRMPFHNDIPSIYPSLLLLTTLAMSMFCVYICTNFPQMWKAFFYYPTLNPFTLSSPLRWFLLGAWLLPILTIATADDLCRELSLPAAFVYICILLGLCALLFEISIQLATTLLAWPFSIAVIVAVIINYHFHCSTTFICGNCKHRIHHKGQCPYCGTINT